MMSAECGGAGGIVIHHEEREDWEGRGRTRTWTVNGGYSAPQRLCGRTDWEGWVPRSGAGGAIHER